MARIMLKPQVRFSYVKVFEPGRMHEDDELKFSVQVIVDKQDRENLDIISKAIESAKQDGLNKFGTVFNRPIKLPLRDGNEKPDSKELSGKMFLNASSKRKPGVVDRKLNVLTDDAEFYSGCYGIATLSFYPYSGKGSAGIAVGLDNIQKLNDGERLAGAPSPQDDFSVIED